jgi:F0F1-type ATP synthase assembly protein I
MTETKTPTTTPSPTPGAPKTEAKQAAASPRNEFMAAVLGMSWQLAVVVLIPIVGGFELDKVFATSPLLVILGFIIALAGFTLIIRRQLQIFTPPAATTVKPVSKGSSK